MRLESSKSRSPRGRTQFVSFKAVLGFDDKKGTVSMSARYEIIFSFIYMLICDVCRIPAHNHLVISQSISHCHDHLPPNSKLRATMHSIQSKRL